MKKIILLLISSCAFYTFAQMKSTEPEWIALMHTPGVDIGDVKTAYDAYYQSHPFEKNAYTQEFKRMLMKHTRDNNGSLLGQPVDESKFKQKEYLQRTAQAASSAVPDWSCIGPFDFDKESVSKSYAPGAAHVYTVEQAASNPQVLYSGTANAGVWKTINKGNDWACQTTGMMLTTVRALEIDYSNENTVYFNGAGKIYKSIDGGSSWSATGSAAFQATFIDANDIVMSPVNNQRLWAATQQGLYYTANAGGTWDTLASGIWQELEFKPGDPNTMYAVKQTGVRTEFYKSTNGGLSFINSNTGYPVAVAPEEQKRTEIAVTPAAPNIVYAFATGAADGGSGLYGIYVSHDAGNSWSFQCCGTGPGGVPDSSTNKNLCAWSEHGDDDGGQYYYDLALEVSPFDSNEVHANAVNHWVSYDGGVNFYCPAKWSHSNKVNYIHADIHDCHFYGNDWWWACDGGIFYSSTQYDTVSRKQFGIAGTDFWGFGVGEWDGDEVIVGGTYHNGTLLKDKDVYANGWLSTMGGDNILGSVNYGYPRIIFSDYGKYKLSGDAGVGLSQMACGMLPSSSYVIGETADQEYSPFAYNVVYIANGSSIWKSEDNGATYNEYHNFGTGKVTSIELSWQDPKVMYAVLYPGWWSNKVLYKTTDGGLTWTNVTPANSVFNGVNLWAPFDIAISTEDDRKLWLVRTPQSSSYNNLNGYKVFQTSDGGTSWTNLTTTTLDGEYITNIEYQRGLDAVYIGTRRAVYYRKQGMPDWQLFNSGLPATISSVGLLIDYKEQKIRNATNRSVWEAPLIEHSPVKATLTVNSNTIYCTRDTVYYLDHSAVTDSNTTWLWSFPGGTPSSSTLRNPKVVYGAPGTYSASLTVSDAFGTDSQTRTNFVTVYNGCAPEEVPGNALHTDGATGYASAEPLNLNSNQVTISAWIRPNGTQNDWSGLVFTRSNASTCGLSILTTNEIRFHWNGNRWWIGTGLTVPDNEWSHVALVATPTSATVYVNGKGYTDLSPCGPALFDSNLLFGLDPCCDRYFKGEIDEVAVYNRSMTQNEVRELMHLTRKPQTDPSLVAYYQFNESTGLITDRVGVKHASLMSGASRITSTGPFGGGSSFRTNVPATGNTTFYGTGLQLSFPAGAMVPNGEVVASRINLHPDELPAPFTPARSYWILDNYGANQTVGNPDAIRLDSVGLVSSTDAANPNSFHLFTRSHNADGPTWGGAIDSADAASAGSDGVLLFQGAINCTELGQLAVSNLGSQITTVKHVVSENYANAFVVYPNPSVKGGAIEVKTNLSAGFDILVYDAAGKEVIKQSFLGSTRISTEALPSGVYFYSVRGAAHLENGQFVIE